MKQKKVIESFFLVIAGGVLFFLLAEVITRVVMPTSVKLRVMHQPDERVGYTLVPGYEMEYKKAEFDTVITINSQGLRDYERQEEKPPSTYRILVMGDSFTFGLGVNSEETYSKVLETLLNESVSANGPKKYEVINAGVDGYGTEQEYEYLKELGKRYNPDVVIIGLYSNDISDVMLEIPFIYKKNRIKTSLYFLSYLKGLYTILKATLRRDMKTKFLQIYQNNYPPQVEKAIQKTKKFLVKSRDFSHSIDAEMLLMIIPLGLEVARSKWQEGRFGHLYSDDFFNNNMHKFSTMFTEFGKAEKIHTLPLLPIFRKSEKKLYYTHDSHWNSDGHLLAGTSIYNVLKTKRMLGD